jgi:phage shock protein PspC (stress-responsive transcriptional regulator)
VKIRDTQERFYVFAAAERADCMNNLIHSRIFCSKGIFLVPSRTYFPKFDAKKQIKREGFEVCSILFIYFCEKLSNYSVVMAKLTRSKNQMIAGVCAGIAEYLGWDTTLVRVVYALLTIFTAFAGVIVYLILWIVMPKA